MTTTTRLRATLADGALVTRRRAGRDVTLLTVGALLLLTSFVLSLAVPRLADRAADAAVRDTAATAGARTDLTARHELPFDAPEEADERWYGTAVWLDTQFRGPVSPAVLVAATRHESVEVDDRDYGVRLVHVWTPRDTDPPVRWVAGGPDVERAAAPLPDGRELVVVPVGLSTASARTLGLDLDDGPVTILEEESTYSVARVVVSGVYEVVDPTDVRWLRDPDLLEPQRTPPSSTYERTLAAYVSTPEDLDLVANRVSAVTASARVSIDVPALTLDGARGLAEHARRLAVGDARFQSAFPEVVDGFEVRLAAARAQAALVGAGLATTSALCLVLVATLLAERRRTVLEAERARGASVASLAWRGLLESGPVVLATAAVAVVGVDLLLPGGPRAPMLGLAVAVVALLAPAVLAVRTGTTAFAGRRVPADRRERAAVAARRNARRWIAEAVLVVVAAGAVVSLQRRGLLPGDSGEADPLLAAAPVLLTAAVALVVVRLAPAAVRVVGRLAARSRGLAAPLAAARAHGAATAFVPLLALTTAVAMVVLSGTTLHTVRVGQEQAADLHVGATARLDGNRLDREEGTALLAALAEEPGVTHVVRGGQSAGRPLAGYSGLRAQLLAVDAEGFAAARASVGLPVEDALADLGRPSSGGRVPALVSPALLAAEEDGPLRLSIVTTTVELDVRGTTDMLPERGAPPTDEIGETEFVGHGVVVVDRDLLTDLIGSAPKVDRAWVVGPGAVDAVTGLDAATSEVGTVTVTTRDGWLAQWSRTNVQSALAVGLLGSAALEALLAALAVVLVVVATARERGRTLSALRTLGLDGRTASWATFGELAPLALGAVLAGTAVGMVMPRLLGGAMGLDLLTGHPAGTTVELTWWPVAAAVAAVVVALLVGVAVERLVRRRDRLGEVLRVGDR